MEVTKETTYNLLDLNEIDIKVLKTAIELYINQCSYDKNMQQVKTMLKQIKAIAGI